MDPNAPNTPNTPQHSNIDIDFPVETPPSPATSGPLEFLRGMRLVVLDTETTGFGVARGARAIEVAGALFVDLQPCGWFTTLVNHGIDVPAEATKVHGITTEQVRRGGCGVVDAAQMIAAFLRSADAIVFHNASFDLPFVRQILDAGGNTTPAGLLYHPLDLPIIDTLGLARLQGHKQNSLADVVARTDVQPENAHRALGDAMMTGRIVGPLIESAILANPGAGFPPAEVDRLRFVAALSESVMRSTEAKWGRRVDFRQAAGLPPRA